MISQLFLSKSSYLVDMTDEELLELRRVEAVKRSAARTLVRDTVMLCIFTWVVFSLSYVARDDRDYRVHTSIHDMFLDGNLGFASSVSISVPCVGAIYFFIPNF